jgi:hypothetical protein
MIATLCLTLSLLTGATNKPGSVPADWREIVAKIHENTASTRASAKGYFAVKSPFGFVTVSLTAASAPGRLYFRTDRFLMAPSVSIIVGRKSTYLLYNDEKQGLVVKSSDAGLITESLGYDLGLSPRGWGELLAGRILALGKPVAQAGDATNQFRVMEEDKPDLVYLIDGKTKQLLQVEDKAHGWSIKYTCWMKLPSGDVPTVWRLSLGGEEKLIVHLENVVDGTKGVSFLPPADFVICPYPSPKEENQSLQE